MKPDKLSREDLANRLAAAVASSGLSYAEIGRKCGVDGSQVSRICRGDFKTLSNNVMQICTFLRIGVSTPTPAGGFEELQAALSRLWNGTSEDAQRVAAVLDGLSALRGAERQQR